MKAKLLIPFLFVLLIGCEKTDELPDELIILEPVENLADSLSLFFPEGKNIMLGNPEFFSDSYQKKIVLTRESTVYVTFINEAAEYRSSLCWYSYNSAKSPGQPCVGQVLFPNISKVNEGGILEPGYTLQLGTGKFPAGTVIGFFLVVNGWEDGKINYDKPKHYTDYQFNAGGKQQHILFKSKDFDYIIIGFEDMSILEDATDCDFNDILFSVTDNDGGYEAISFDTSNMIIK